MNSPARIVQASSEPTKKNLNHVLFTGFLIWNLQGFQSFYAYFRGFNYIFSVCAEETNIVSNCEGGNIIP